MRACSCRPNRVNAWLTAAIVFWGVLQPLTALGAMFGSAPANIVSQICTVEGVSPAAPGHRPEPPSAPHGNALEHCPFCLQHPLVFLPGTDACHVATLEYGSSPRALVRQDAPVSGNVAFSRQSRAPPLAS